MSGKFILASASPQRRKLLEQIGIDPIVVPADIPENLDQSHIEDSLKTLARDKTMAVTSALTRKPGSKVTEVMADPNPRESEIWVLGADTVIHHEGGIIGKANDIEQAKTTLDRLSGQEHSVLTGVCVRKTRIEPGALIDVAPPLTVVAETRVRFKLLSAEEINWYIETGEWANAAGAYRIQGRGACIVEAIYGSYSNVVGLPIERIYGMLTELDFTW